MDIYWGDLHNHCGITYGFGSLENAIERAKNHLDFCAFTGHAMWPDMYEKTEETAFVVGFHEEGFTKLQKNWEAIRCQVAAANTKDFVTFQGYEMHSCEYGDHHIISKDDNLPLVYQKSPRELVKASGVEAIVIPHHIGYTPNYRGIDWDKFDAYQSPVVEVYSKHGSAMNEEGAFPYYHNMGPRDTRNLVYEGLKKGHQFGFIASTDHHAGFPGSYGDGLVAVWADSKTRESIWEGIINRHTYAVTGDKIKCAFSVNNSLMGSKITASRRQLTYSIETEYALDKIIVYKNLKPIHIVNGELNQVINEEGEYKLRIEMGWGDKEAYQWLGSVEVEDGTIAAYTPYYRGRSVLAPSKEETYDSDSINNMKATIHKEGSRKVVWACDTVGNKSTLHPSTSSVVIKIKGSIETKVSIILNGKQHVATIGELIAYGYTEHIKYYHSQAYKVHRVLPESQYNYSLELEDNDAENTCDIYHVEVTQRNGHCAYLSPIYVEDSV